jgi:xylulokinase
MRNPTPVSAEVVAVGGGLWKDFNRSDEIHQVQYTATPQDRDAAIYEKLLPPFRLGTRQQAKLGDMLAELEL